MSLYVVYKYIMMTRKIEKETKNRIQWFSIGVIIVVIGILINLVGGFFRSAELLIEILALIAIDIGSLAILKGFLI